MRTWSVSGTAFALCTRSSSLSISTRTSMWSQCTACAGLLLWVLRRSGPSAGEELLEPARYRLRHQLVDAPAEACDLLHAARGDEAHLRACHHVDRLDVGRKRAVQLVHLELPLEVGDHAEAFDDHLCVPLVCEI